MFGLKRSPDDVGVQTSAADDLALRATGIAKSYSTPTGRLEVLKGVNLEIRRGTILAILGASGVGKSTLLNILGTLDQADSGTLESRGRRLDRLGPAELASFRARHLGFVFQFHHLLPEFTAEENVMMPLLIAGRPHEDARERARRALRDVGLHERWLHHPAQLSGGEAQRVAVARALVAEPELVLADEPSGNLDSRNAGALHELLASLARDRHQTFVVATHNDSLAARADRVLTLESGVLRGEG
jgi:lipoprotein-releasing system ATP-binding protein